MNLSRLRRGLLVAYFRYIAQNNKFLYYQVTGIPNRYSRTFFVSKVQVALIIEGVFFNSLSFPPELVPGVCSLAFLQGAGGSRKETEVIEWEETRFTF